MKHFTAIEYIAIDIANTFGLDKLNYEDRIQWVRDNLNQLEELTEQAEEPHLYFKAVNAFRKALKGLPVGHTVALDAVCSGLQIMSVLTGDESGCYMTGLIDPDNRTDAYSLVTEHMNEMLDSEIQVPRKDAKQATMTTLYGSTATPKKIFGDGTTEYFAFINVLKQYASGAYWLLQELKKAWNPSAYSHSWYLPDGHYAFVPVMVTKEDRVSVAELDYTMSVMYQVNEPTDFGISIPANVIHSVDAYVLRCMVRRCNYNPKKVNQALDLIQIELLERTLEGTEPQVFHERMFYYSRHGMVDVREIDFITEDNISGYSSGYLTKLANLLSTMLEHEPFEIITIHDSFACHPNHCNRMRYWYKETLAELAESKTLEYLLQQIYKNPDITFTPMGEVASKIRNSEYGIC